MLLEEGLGLILTLVDIISFFDRENIYDVMQTLHEIGVNKKAAKVWFMLNEGTEIAVKTIGGVSTTAGDRRWGPGVPGQPRQRA